MSSRRLIATITGSLAAIALVVGLAASITMGLEHTNAAADTCKGKPSVLHEVSIHNSVLRPTATYGHLCDRITFTNHDNITREMAFGAHEDHVPYDGVAEKVLGKDQSFTITLNQEGTFHVHDHLHDEVAGYFTVTK